jgi:hypothetical protein
MAEKKNTKKMPPWIGSKADKKQDKEEEKGMTPAQKRRFEKEDKNKNLSKSQDTAKDKALAAKLKREENAKKKKTSPKKGK